MFKMLVSLNISSKE